MLGGGKQVGVGEAGEGENEQRKRRGSESGELGTGMESKGVLEETEFSKSNGHNWKWI